MFKQFLIKYFPWLGKYKRFAVAVKSHFSGVRKSYGQHGEDAIVYDLLLNKGITKGVYVDVGANHPSTISNTYLLYRKGFRGLVIEPNPELIRLFRIFRARDIALMLGCGEAPAVLPFHISNTPVLSSFTTTKGVIADIQVQILPLDEITGKYDYTTIDFLSIDVEGMNLAVLKGASQTIKRSSIICIEYDNQAGIAAITACLDETHVLYKKLPVNIIFISRQWDERR